MKNKILILVSAILLMNIMLVSADVKYFQQQVNYGSGIINNNIIVKYTISKQSRASTLDTQNYLSVGKPYEMDFKYSTSINSWNSDYPEKNISYCKLGIIKSRTIQIVNSSGVYNLYNSSLILNINFTSDNDILGEDYFVQLYDNDQVNVNFVCYFDDLNYSDVRSPVEIYGFSPTRQCKACQYSDWYNGRMTFDESKTLGSYINTDISFVKQFIGLNFEIVLYLFWIAMLLLFFFAIGIIFWGVYWLYLFLSMKIK